MIATHNSINTYDMIACKFHLNMKHGDVIVLQL